MNKGNTLKKYILGFFLMMMVIFSHELIGEKILVLFVDYRQTNKDRRTKSQIIDIDLSKNFRVSDLKNIFINDMNLSVDQLIVTLPTEDSVIKLSNETTLIDKIAPIVPEEIYDDEDIQELIDAHPEITKLTDFIVHIGERQISRPKKFDDTFFTFE